MKSQRYFNIIAIPKSDYLLNVVCYLKSPQKKKKWKQILENPFSDNDADKHNLLSFCKLKNTTFKQKKNSNARWSHLLILIHFGEVPFFGTVRVTRLDDFWGWRWWWWWQLHVCDGRQSPKSNITQATLPLFEIFLSSQDLALSNFFSDIFWWLDYCFAMYSEPHGNGKLHKTLLSTPDFCQAVPCTKLCKVPQ